jgi:hypothetical protein
MHHLKVMGVTRHSTCFGVTSLVEAFCGGNIMAAGACGSQQHPTGWVSLIGRGCGVFFVLHPSVHSSYQPWCCFGSAFAAAGFNTMLIVPM